MNDKSVQIVAATESDLPAIAALAGVIWRACFREVISPAQIEFMLDWMYSLERLELEMQVQGIHFEQLRVADELAGFASYGLTCKPGICKLHKLYVHPGQQRRGLGSQLLGHCEQRAATLGAQQMILAVNKRNERAIHTYRKNGYSIVDSTVTDIGGGFVMDDHVMAKGLSGSSSQIPLQS
jgi:diamine N-acetyltransferase